MDIQAGNADKAHSADAMTRDGIEGDRHRDYYRGASRYDEDYKEEAGNSSPVPSSDDVDHINNMGNMRIATNKLIE
ncbi:hypothetical protein ACHAQD_012245 [Fusarium lateritium]